VLDKIVLACKKADTSIVAQKVVDLLPQKAFGH